MKSLQQEIKEAKEEFQIYENILKTTESQSEYDDALFAYFSVKHEIESLYKEYCNKE